MSELIDTLLTDARERMAKTVESTTNELGSVRTGRATTSLLDRVVVDYYGAPTPLKQLATLGTPEARLLTVQPFDAGSLKLIEKAIVDSGLGLTPNNDGKIIRINIPELNEERRKDMVKVAKKIGEEGKIAMRNVRRDVLHDLKKLKDDGDVGADDEHRAEGELQKITDAAIADLDGRLKAKEEEILEV
ncbi:MAG: ribosome recycling factor [Solirubrobacteraceae bacterium]|nr:ribosome recycling factor [Solirubrobacteraceae bacterium]